MNLFFFAVFCFTQVNKSSRPILFSFEFLFTNAKPEVFLSNESNKKNFIAYLIAKLQEVNIDTVQADEDADFLIVECAKAKASMSKNALIVGQDVDLLIILSLLQNENVYFWKPHIGKVASKLFDRNSFNFPQLQKYLGFIHAFSGCDTTSAFFNIGKKNL